MFVPVVTPPQSPPSAHARELGGLIAQVVQDYRDDNPEATPTDVQGALDVAREELRSKGACGSCAMAPVVLLIAGLLALAAGMGVFFMRRAGTGPPTTWMPVAAVAATIVLLAVVAIARRR